MKQHSYIVVFITVKDTAEAERIADALLKQKQAACVNILPQVDSRFWWQDKLDSGQESMLVVKTRESLLPEIIKSVKKVHSYDVPEIIALPVIGGNRDYLDWIDHEVR